MKKIGLIAALAFTTLLSVNAQNSRHKHEKDADDDGGAKMEGGMPTAQQMADWEVQRQTKALALTPEQVEKVKVIDLKYSQQRLELFNQAKASGDMTGAKNQMDGIRLAQNNDMKGVLSPEQMKKLIKFNKQEDSNAGGYHGSGMRRAQMGGSSGQRF